MNCNHCGRENDDDARFCQGCGAEMNEALSTSQGRIEAEVINLLEREGKIAAIKYYREQTGLGLKESKDVVDRIAQVNNIKAVGSGCLSVLAICLTAVGCLMMWVMIAA